MAAAGTTPAVRRRFLAWKLVVVGTLAADAAFAVTGRPTFAVVAAAALLAMSLLLATTPPDAIRLPRGRGERIIVYGAIVSYTAASLVVDGPMAAVISLAMIGLTFAALVACRLLAASPWWAAVVAWHPLAILAIRGTPVDEAIVAGLGMFLLASVAAMTVARASRP